MGGWGHLWATPRMRRPPCDIPRALYPSARFGSLLIRLHTYITWSLALMRMLLVVSISKVSPIMTLTVYTPGMLSWTTCKSPEQLLALSFTPCQQITGVLALHLNDTSNHTLPM